MQKLTTSRRAGDQLIRALDACCGALRSLEVAGVRAADEHDDELQLHIARAIKALRKTIAELRVLSEADSSARAAGFVLPSGQGDARGGS
jgi:hypothetical protein